MNDEFGPAYAEVIAKDLALTEHGDKSGDELIRRFEGRDVGGTRLQNRLEVLRFVRICRERRVPGIAQALG
jgi:hypothetical protein